LKDFDIEGNVFRNPGDQDNNAEQQSGQKQGWKNPAIIVDYGADPSGRGRGEAFKKGIAISGHTFLLSNKQQYGGQWLAVQ
jgi:hypothetical protein